MKYINPLEKKEKKQVQRNVLIIQYKEYLGKQLLPCINPKQESFKWVRSKDKASAILDKRVKDNIAWALYNGIYLIEPAKEVVKAAPVIAPLVQPTVSTKEGGFIKKAYNKVSSLFTKKLFSRQKH